MQAALPHLASLIGTPSFWEDAFWVLAFHDLGKAASGFQKELQGGERWNYRHEILSAGLALNLPLPEERRLAVALAVLTHHYGYGYLWDNYRTTLEAGRRRWEEKVEELKAHEQELQLFAEECRQWSQALFNQTLELPGGALLAENCQDSVDVLLRPLKANELKLSHSHYHHLLRGIAIACDHLASAGQTSIRPGIRCTLQLLRQACKVKGVRPFQARLAEHQGSAMLSAPTGSGKTAAALLWAQANQDGGRRLFYVLPYTASINAMQRELQQVYGEEEVGTLHHRALYFAYKEFMERGYGPGEATEQARELLGLARKLYKPVKILTPYQILKAFYGVKGFEALLLELSGGLFIFDEIHVYEPHIVALIARAVKELRQLDARFLFMSATLPKFLRELLMQVAPGMPLVTLNDQDTWERSLLEQARHCLHLFEGQITDHLRVIKKALAMKGRVLVVANSVQRAQEVFGQLASHARKPLLLHGRFIHRDREHIERELESTDLLVGTQAVEVSLNVSFDLLFSEPAPIDALLQRMGRVNRFNEHGEPVDVNVFNQGSEADEYIYDPTRVYQTLDCLSGYDGKPVTNAEAAELVEAVYRDGYNMKEYQQYEAARQAFERVIAELPLYDESEFFEEFFDLIKAVDVVPVRFQSEYLQLREAKRYLDAVGYLVPLGIPQFHALDKDGRLSRVKYDLFADARYDDYLGLLWQEPEGIESAMIGR
jgi:CRISPR-associated endonuclease/helicase Cas3